MRSLESWIDRLVTLLTAPIAGSEVTLARVALVLFLLGLLIWLAGRVTRWLVHHVLHRRGLELGTAQAVGTIFRYTVVALGIVVILQGAGINLSALAVLAGALGVGLGFGLQNVTNNFVSGLIILFERPIKVGDRVEVGGVTGDVRRIAARATTVVTNDNIAIIVPNSQFISEQVTNWSYTTRLVRINLEVGVSYKSDPHEVRRILLDVAAAADGVTDDPAPDVVFREFGESSLDFSLRVWTREHTSTPQVLKSALYFSVWDRFRDAGIEIPFPQRDLHIRTGSLEARAREENR